MYFNTHIERYKISTYCYEATLGRPGLGAIKKERLCRCSHCWLVQRCNTSRHFINCSFLTSQEVPPRKAPVSETKPLKKGAICKNQGWSPGWLRFFEHHFWGRKFMASPSKDQVTWYHAPAWLSQSDASVALQWHGKDAERPFAASSKRNILLMQEIRLTSWYGTYRILYRVSYMPGGAGFLSTTVSHNQAGQ